MAKQIDPEASSVQFNIVGGYLRARITIDVTNPIRRWILINSSARNKRDRYDIQYEHVPNFYFSCGRLGHSNLFFPTPEIQDENGDLPFKTSLRAPDDRKRTGSGDSLSVGEYSTKNNKKDMPASSTTKDANPEVISPMKHKRCNANKRKGCPQNQVWRRVELPCLTSSKHAFRMQWFLTM